jgi:hypothetical protein
MLIGLTKISLTKTSFNYPSVKELPLRLPPLKCTQAHSHHEQNKIQTVTVNLTQCDRLFHVRSILPSLFHGGNRSQSWVENTNMTDLYLQSVNSEKDLPQSHFTSSFFLDDVSLLWCLYS